MVKTSDGIMDINPLERMERLGDVETEKKNALASKKKELEDLEKKKKQEIEDLDKKTNEELAEIERKKKEKIAEIEQRKKKELEDLEKKKKELEDLEKKSNSEIEENKNLFEKSFQEFMRQKRLIIEEESKKGSKGIDAMVDDDTSGSKNSSNQNQDLAAQSAYLSNMKIPKNLYDVASRDFYQNISDIRDRAARGDMNQNDEEFIERIKEQFDTFAKKGYTAPVDDHDYIARTQSVIDQISNYKIRHL